MKNLEKYQLTLDRRRKPNKGKRKTTGVGTTIKRFLGGNKPKGDGYGAAVLG